MQTIKIKTWTCAVCEYKQDFEPTQDNMDIHFPSVLAGTCPACHRQKRVSPLVRETNNVKKISMQIAEVGDDIIKDKQVVRKVAKGEYLEINEIQALRAQFEDIG